MLGSFFLLFSLKDAMSTMFTFVLPHVTGVDKRSVDTWMHPNIFHMQFSTGAPPDYFDANGQNWGFPTYNWEEMAKDGYEWWRRRLTTLSQCGLASSSTTESAFHNPDPVLLQELQY